MLKNMLSTLNFQGFFFLMALLTHWMRSSSRLQTQVIKGIVSSIKEKVIRSKAKIHKNEIVVNNESINKPNKKNKITNKNEIKSDDNENKSIHSQVIKAIEAKNIKKNELTSSIDNDNKNDDISRVNNTNDIAPNKPKNNKKIKTLKQSENEMVKNKKTTITLSRDFELKYLKEGQTLDNICGADEAGRGPLAGPVVCAACIVPSDVFIEGINDSKQILDENLREILYEKITSNPKIIWSAVEISPQRIDEINILQSSLDGMRQAVNKLSVKPEIALIDGNKLPGFNNVHPKLTMRAEAIVKGDSKSYSIATASIIAKVTRDRIMLKFDKLHPQYNFKQHKGYPTVEHIGAIRRHGILDIHRLTYKPLSTMVLNKKKVTKSAMNHNNNNQEKIEIEKEVSEDGSRIFNVEKRTSKRLINRESNLEKIKESNNIKKEEEKIKENNNIKKEEEKIILTKKAKINEHKKRVVRKRVEIELDVEEEKGNKRRKK